MQDQGFYGICKEAKFSTGIYIISKILQTFLTVLTQQQYISTGLALQALQTWTCSKYMERFEKFSLSKYNPDVSVNMKQIVSENTGNTFPSKFETFLINSITAQASTNG